MARKKERRSIQYFSEVFKRSVIEEHLYGGESKSSLQRKYGIKGKCAILNWMRSLGYVAMDKSGKLAPRITPESFYLDNSSKKQEDLSKDALAEKVRWLERQLAAEQVKNSGLNYMIDLAEKEFKIRIRKKSGTK